MNEMNENIIVEIGETQNMDWMCIVWNIFFDNKSSAACFVRYVSFILIYTEIKLTQNDNLNERRHGNKLWKQTASKKWHLILLSHIIQTICVKFFLSVYMTLGELLISTKRIEFHEK